MKRSKLDMYISNKDDSSKREKSGLNGSKGGNDDTAFRGFKRVNDMTAGTTHGYDEQGGSDATRASSIEDGARVSSSMSTKV
ncbi:MAG: hypothetical protein DRQ88_09350 [Epsilonproteobacteria bacterium]|nr:MAG: hypothetical protein DRQ88_09350 [Campylobacterota bacterium]